MLITSNAQKLYISTRELCTKTVVQSYFRVIDVHVQLFIFLVTIFDCKSVMMVQRILPNVFPKMLCNGHHNLNHYLVKYLFKSKIVQYDPIVIHRVWMGSWHIIIVTELFKISYFIHPHLVKLGFHKLKCIDPWPFLLDTCWKSMFSDFWIF